MSSGSSPSAVSKGNTSPTLSGYEKFIALVQKIFCYDVEVPVPAIFSYMSNQNGKMCWTKREVPVVQYIIQILYTIFAVFPDSTIGQSAATVFSTCILGLFLLYLGIRFLWVTENQSKITECDAIIIQTVIFVVGVEFISKNFGFKIM
jgi:hypothetical protein